MWKWRASSMTWHPQAIVLLCTECVVRSWARVLDTNSRLHSTLLHRLNVKNVRVVGSERFFLKKCSAQKVPSRKAAADVCCFRLSGFSFSKVSKSSDLLFNRGCWKRNWRKRGELRCFSDSRTTVFSDGQSVETVLSFTSCSCCLLPLSVAFMVRWLHPSMLRAKALENCSKFDHSNFLSEALQWCGTMFRQAWCKRFLWKPNTKTYVVGAENQNGFCAIDFACEM